MSTALANGVAGLAISGYVLAIVFKKRGAELLATAGEDVGFIKWLAAVLLVLALWSKLGKAAAPLMALTFAAIAFSAQQSGALDKALADFNAFFKG